MSIRREDLDADRIDLSDIVTGERMPELTPGDILRSEFLEPLNLSVYALAKAINVPLNRLTAILSGERAITADTALRLGLFFGMEARYWVNLQAAYDLQVAQRNTLAQIASRVRVFRPTSV